MRPLAAALLALAAALPACGEPFAPRLPAAPEHRAPRPARLASPERQTPVELLGGAAQFQTSQVGYAGFPSAYAAAWRVVMTAPDARNTFAALYDQATTVEGRLYALVGVQVTDPVLAATYLNDPSWQVAEVRTLFGCIGAVIPVSRLLSEIRSGEWGRQFQSGLLESALAT